MVGSQFIEVSKNGRRTLLNTAHITSVSARDILLTSVVRRYLWQFPPEQEIGYMVQVAQPDGPNNFLFTDAKERDELLDKLIAAISPSVSIDSAPGLPYTSTEQARLCPIGRYFLEGKEYATRAEYQQARDELEHREILEDMETARRLIPNTQSSFSSPAPRPPRKPYTRKPKQPGQ